MLLGYRNSNHSLIWSAWRSSQNWNKRHLHHLKHHVRYSNKVTYGWSRDNFLVSLQSEKGSVTICNTEDHLNTRKNRFKNSAMNETTNSDVVTPLPKKIGTADRMWKHQLFSLNMLETTCVKPCPQRSISEIETTTPPGVPRYFSTFHLEVFLAPRHLQFHFLCRQQSPQERPRLRPDWCFSCASNLGESLPSEWILLWLLWRGIFLKILLTLPKMLAPKKCCFLDFRKPRYLGFH